MIINDIVFTDLPPHLSIPQPRSYIEMPGYIGGHSKAYLQSVNLMVHCLQVYWGTLPTGTLLSTAASGLTKYKQ